MSSFAERLRYALNARDMRPSVLSYKIKLCKNQDTNINKFNEYLGI